MAARARVIPRERVKRTRSTPALSNSRGVPVTTRSSALSSGSTDLKAGQPTAEQGDSGERYRTLYGFYTDEVSSRAPFVVRSVKASRSRAAISVSSAGT